MSESYELFQTSICPFCGMVSRFLDTKGIDIPRRDIARDPEARTELVAGGGRPTVPCLKISTPASESGAESGPETQEVQWLYESQDIMRYLNEKFSQA